MVEEEEVRNPPFPYRPHMLPSQRSIRLVTADRGCRLVLASMEVEDRVDVELSEARVLSRPSLSQHRGNQGIRPSVVGDANGPGCEGLDDAFAERVEGGNGDAPLFAIRDHNSRLLQSILHFL